MRLLLLNAGPIATIDNGDPTIPLKGADMSDTEKLTLPRGYGILIENGIVYKIGQTDSLNNEFGSEDTESLSVIDCNNQAIIPGFVDSHTHLLWDGDRANEMHLRQQGLSYSDIANLGGGITKTVEFTRNAPIEN